MHNVVMKLDSDGIEKTTVEVGNDATTKRISPRNAKRIQEFVDSYQVEIDVVGSRVDLTKQLVPGQSDWDYLIKPAQDVVPRKSLRAIEKSANKYLPRSRLRTDNFGNTRAGLDVECNVPLIAGKPYVKFRPRA